MSSSVAFVPCIFDKNHCWEKAGCHILCLSTSKLSRCIKYGVCGGHFVQGAEANLIFGSKFLIKHKHMVNFDVKILHFCGEKWSKTVCLWKKYVANVAQCVSCSKGFQDRRSLGGVPGKIRTE